MIRRLISATILVSLCIFSSPALVQAIDLFGPTCNDSTKEAAACKDRVKRDPVTNEPLNPLTGPDGLIVNITDIVAFVAGAAAVILIVVGGIRYMTASGDAGKITSARNTILNAFIGLIIIALARALVVFIVKKL
jgi:hypothetical protein